MLLAVISVDGVGGGINNQSIRERTAFKNNLPEPHNPSMRLRPSLFCITFCSGSAPITSVHHSSVFKITDSSKNAVSRRFPASHGPRGFSSPFRFTLIFFLRESPICSDDSRGLRKVPTGASIVGIHMLHCTYRRA